MGRWAIWRILASALILWVVATTTFLLVSMAPGDAANALNDGRIPPKAREIWRRQFGLDQPIPTRYWHWLTTSIRGDLGFSWHLKRPVSTVLAEALPNTIVLTGLGLLVELTGGIVLALWQARRPHGKLDRSISLFSLISYATPTFAVGLMLVWLFSYQLGWFPPSHMGATSASELVGFNRWMDIARHLFLPALAIGITGVGAVARYLRGSLLDERAEHYTLAAKARGCSVRQAIFSHALPNAALPLVTMIGMSLPFLVSGSLIIEVVFAWPGMGRMMYDAALARDVPLLMGGTLVATLAIVVGNFASDLGYALLDPRVRL